MALGRLFSALPVRQGDAADQIEVYVFALDEVTHHALDTVVAQAIRGSHPKFSRKFAPTCAELGEAIIDEMERVKRQMELAQEKLRIEDNRPVAAAPRLFEQRAADARAKMEAEGRRFLFEADSFSAAASSRRNLRPGSTYVGILGAWYGPEGSLHEPEVQTVTEDEMQEMLRADMFEPETGPPADPEPDAATASESQFEEVEF
ncbi:hypothetical protein GGE17_003550 [Rhizobium leguminosarum]|nr:hypothetical protein [Rhizobium leguminosarum]MBB4342126.1 hypothetical protein [Rhizobium leguminosarum]